MLIQVRRFEQDDAEALSALIVQNLYEVVSQEYSPEAIELLVASFTPSKLIQDSHSQTTWVGMLDQQHVGTASLYQDRIRSVFVEVAKHGTGIGRTLMREVEDEARRQALPKLYLMAGLSASGFYRKLGYQTVARVNRVVDGVPLPVVRMEKSIAAVESAG